MAESKQGTGTVPGSRSNLEILAVDEVTWRVRPRGAEEGRLMGLVQKDGAVFDVLGLTPAPVACGRFRSWDDALSALRSCFSAIEPGVDIPIVVRRRDMHGEYVMEHLRG